MSFETKKSLKAVISKKNNNNWETTHLGDLVIYSSVRHKKNQKIPKTTFYIPAN